MGTPDRVSYAELPSGHILTLQYNSLKVEALKVQPRNLQAMIAGDDCLEYKKITVCSYHYGERVN
jgi:hypothetical protein